MHRLEKLLSPAWGSVFAIIAQGAECLLVFIVDLLKI
jgi:hypothetical protein